MQSRRCCKGSDWSAVKKGSGVTRIDDRTIPTGAINCKRDSSRFLVPCVCSELAIVQARKTRKNFIRPEHLGEKSGRRVHEWSLKKHYRKPILGLNYKLRNLDKIGTAKAIVLIPSVKNMGTLKFPRPISGQGGKWTIAKLRRKQKVNRLAEHRG